jgi:hypothetical protein
MLIGEESRESVATRFRYDKIHTDIKVSLILS